MRKFLTAALAALAVLVTPLAFVAAPAVAAGGAPDYATKVVTLLASAQRTSTATGSSVSTAITTYPGTGITLGVTQGMTVFLSVTAAAAGTLDLTIEGSPDGTIWATLTPNAAWTQVTTSTGTQSRYYVGPVPPYIRAKGTQATSPNHTYSVKAVLGG